MAGARPRGNLPVENVFDDEEENSADSVEQAALEGARRDDILEPDSLMFEELDDDRKLPLDDEEEDEDEAIAMARKGEGSVASPEALYDETDSIINTPYGSPLSDIGSMSNNQKWIGEVKKMLLDDQEKSENRAKAWASTQADSFSALSFSSGGIQLAPEEGNQWREGLEDLLPEMDLDMPSAEELAEKYSNQLIEKDMIILDKDKRISVLEKAQRDLESTLEDCQKDLRLKNETATLGVEKLKKSLEEKDKSIMETSERLRKVTESYNSSEKRWKEQQEFLEKQIQKLKSELEERNSLGEEIQKISETARLEKQSLERKLAEAKEANDLLKRQFSQEKEKLSDELDRLRDEKAALETELQEKIELLQNQLLESQALVEKYEKQKESMYADFVEVNERLKEFQSTHEEQKAQLKLLADIEEISRVQMAELQESSRVQMATLEETARTDMQKLTENVAHVTKVAGEYKAQLQATQTENENLLKQLQEREKQLDIKQREMEIEKESMLKEIEEVKERVEVEVEEAPVNFFTQTAAPPPTDSWKEKQKSLENRIAELELEKGNLLLQLVDVDEHEQQEAQNKAELAAEETSRQLETVREALQELERKNGLLERELEETKTRETQRIETDMTTIAWEEKYEELQKQNVSLSEELQSQRRAGDELSSRYEELEQKFAELEMSKPPIEGIVEIDKCDGWSDDTPQLQDEGFTEMETQISELKAELHEKQQQVDEKQKQIDDMLQSHKNTADKLVEKSLLITQLEARIEEITVENTSYSRRLQECRRDLEQVRQELLDRAAQQDIAPPPYEANDGWADDAPVLLDEGFQEYNPVAELKQELSKKEEELKASMDRCKTFEDKMKKALKALKQKNDKLNELKSRLGEDAMSASSVSPMESSMVMEPVVGRSSASETGSSSSANMRGEIDRWQRESEAKEARIQELEAVARSLQENHAKNLQMAAGASAQELATAIAQRDIEIETLKSELGQLAAAMHSKNEEVVQLMKTCEEMQRSVDEKVELLNDCVSKKDIEVKQAISQYEDFLKDATLNVSHLTKELEEKIREINNLNGQVLDAQQQAIDIQNEYDSYREDTQNLEDKMEEKEHEIDQLKKLEQQLRDEISRLQSQLSGSFNNHSLMSEALDRAEAEKIQLREECVCIQTEYGNKNKELQVQISQLIDQLNEREGAVSVMEARLMECDEASGQITSQIKQQLEEKCKTLEQTEQALFVKTEDCLRLEERLREAEENFRREMSAKLTEVQEQHRVSIEAFAAQTAEDLERTCEQLAKKNNEVSELQQKYNQLQEQLTKLQEDYNTKCSETSQTEKMVQEFNAYKAGLEESMNSYSYSLNQANAELVAKNEEIHNLKTICSQYEEKCYNSAVSQEGMQRSLQESQSALTQCQQELGTYYNELQNSKMESEALRNSQSEYQQTIDRLNTELNEAKTEAARHSTDVQNMTNQLAKYQDIEANLNRYLEDLNSATEELGKRNSEYRELENLSKVQEVQIKSLQERHESAKFELSEAYKLVSEKEERVAKLESEVLEMRVASQKDEVLTGKTKELLEDLEEKNREISDLRFELEEGIIQEKRLKENLDSRENEIKQLRNLLEEKEREVEDAWQSFKFQAQSSTPLPKDEVEDGSLVDRLEQVEKEKLNLERKVDLLQNKLEEVEASEIKCYEDFSRLKVLRTELEMDNLRMSAELEQLRRSLQDGDNDPKYKSIENQLILMTKTLEDRDKLCRDLMKNVSQLQESYDALRIRVNSMTLPQPFALSPDSLEAKFIDQDREIFSLRVDLEREKKIRELYEGQLFLATSKKQFENSTRKSTSSGSWFGFGELFSSPPRPSPSPNSRSGVSATLAPPAHPHPSLDHNMASASVGRPVTPVTPATAFSSSLFDTSGNAGQGPQYFVPQMTPAPVEGTQSAPSSSAHIAESPYGNFPTQP